MSDRRLWLEELCPTCGARGGLRCQTSRYSGKPSRVLHAARGWRQRSCPTCKAQAGELCKTPTGRRAGQPHTARLHPGRRELFAEQGVWEELGRWEAAVALVRFSGGGGNQGSIAAVTLEDAHKRELARWGSGEGELPEALAAPIWGRYALFRGHPRISGLLMWDAPARPGRCRGRARRSKVRGVAVRPRHPYRSPITSVAATARDTSRTSAPPAGRDTAPAAVPEASRSCERCGEPLPAGLRAEARYCSKRCRQAASRARVKDGGKSHREAMRRHSSRRRAKRTLPAAWACARPRRRILMPVAPRLCCGSNAVTGGRSARRRRPPRRRRRPVPGGSPPQR